MILLPLILVLLPGNATSSAYVSRPNSPPSSFFAQAPNASSAAALDLIRRRQYGEAITRLERILELNPNNGEALTYLATANLYNDLNFTKAKKDFDEALKAGGGATFFVTHSHEKIVTGDVVNYCRGWLHFRRDGVTFVPEEGDHGLNLKYSEIVEFKQNRLSKTFFHINAGAKTQNFRGRSTNELEALLILAVYRSFFSQLTHALSDSQQRTGP